MEYIDMQSARVENPEPETPDTPEAPEEAASPAAEAAPAAPAAADLIKDAEKRRFDQAFTRLSQREARAVEREQAVRAEKAEVERARAELAREKAEIEAQRQQYQTQEQKLRMLREDPNVVRAFQENNLDLEDIVKRMANNNSPENIARGLELRMEEAIKAQAAEIERLKKAEEARLAEREEMTARQQLQADRDWAVDYIDKADDRFPKLALQPPGKIVGLLEFIGEDLKKKEGRAAHIDRVAQIAEDLLVQEAQFAATKAAAKAAKRIPATAPQAAPAAQPTNPSPGTAPASTSESDDPELAEEVKRRRQLRPKASPTSVLQTGERATTISNRAAAERGAPAQPITREELRKRLGDKYLT